MPSRDDFFSTLTDAVNDLVDNGFSSAERIFFWQEKIKKAAEHTLQSTQQMEQALRDVLAAVYRKQIDKGAILDLHPGLKRFTLEMVRPQLRAELDRRQMASYNLIKLNREQMIAKMQQRFAGWATSIPKGGSDNAEKAKIKDDIKKPLRSLAWEERRVQIDQGHKMVSNLNSILATDGGAIAGVWEHVHQKGYDARPDHLARDGKVFLVKGSWAQNKGLVKPGKDGTTDDIEQPAEFPFCFPGLTRIPFADGVEKAYRHWYSGELTEIVTDSGKTLSATPNHPVLTPNGWIAIGLLKEGDHIIEIAEQDFKALEENHHNTIPALSEIFHSSRGFGVTKITCGKVEQFHGDGTEGNVDIVTTTRPLRFWEVAALPKLSENFFFSVPFYCRSIAGALKAFKLRCLGSATSFMSSMRESLTPFFAFLLHPEQVCFVPCPETASGLHDVPNDDVSPCSIDLDERVNAFSSFVSPANFLRIKEILIPLLDRRSEVEFSTPLRAPDSARSGPENLSHLFESFPFATQTSRIVDVSKKPWSSHVYNLQTVDGWYSAEGVITHNCRCRYRFIYSLGQVPKELLTKKGEQALAEARAELTS